MNWAPYTREQTLRQTALRALILSIPFTGLGHAYAGNAKRGYAWIGAFAVCVLLLIGSAASGPAWLAGALGLAAAGVVVAAAVDAMRLAQDRPATAKNRASCVIVVMALAAVYLLAAWLADPMVFVGAFKGRPVLTRALIAQPA